MKKIPLTITLLALSLSSFVFGLYSCKKEKFSTGDGIGSLKLSLAPRFDGNPFEVGTVYYDYNGNRIRIDDFKVYFSRIAAIRSDNTEYSLSDIDLFQINETQEISFQLPVGSYKGLKFSVGVPQEWNKDQDPTQYPNSHPLSVNGAQGMFWHWNTGYVFFKVEGKADLSGTEGADLLHPFAFHCGEDVLYRTHVFDNNPFVVSEGSEARVAIRMDVNRFFYNETDSIDLGTEYLTHTSGNLPLAMRFTELFNAAISLE
jgi:hypothetical protein